MIEIAGAVGGYLISWPKMEAYFIDNIAVDPARQGLGLGRQLMEHAAREACMSSEHFGQLALAI